MTDLPSSSELRSQLVTSPSGHKYAPMSVRKIAKHKLRAEELGIISYAKHFGDLRFTETWERLLRYRGEFPPLSQPPNSTNNKHPNAIGKTIVPQVNSNFQINVMTDITPEIILQLPILPIEQGNFLPDKCGLYFVCANAINAQIVYTGKTQRLYERWRNQTRRAYCKSEAEKIKSAAIRDELKFLEQLGLDL